MKKFLSLLLCLCMLIGLVACGSAEGGSAATSETTAAPLAFRVGYHKVNITPEQPTGLAGYGNTEERKHTEVLDYIYITCVAISDEEDNTVLLFSADVCTTSSVMVSALRSKVSEKTGVPATNMMFNSSHTHSAPSATGIPTLYTEGALEAAEKALEDRKPATMYFGKAETDGINFVRHYYMNDGSVVTDNHGTTKGKTYAGHCTEVDEEMRILQFKREGGKDVIIANWQSHPHITGGSAKTQLSADIIGAFRTNMENDLDCLFSYYQGGGGNINPTSRIAEENANSKKDWKVHGQMLADTAKTALQNMTQLQTGPIKILSEVHTCATNKADLDKVVVAGEVRAYYNAGHTISETAAFARTLGLESLYHANAIGNRADLGDSFDIDIWAMSIGEFGATFAAHEMFDTIGKYIRDNSPFEYTFSCGYTNGAGGYYPTIECFNYGAYEADTAKIAPGTAEAIGEHFVEMLEKLHG